MVTHDKFVEENNIGIRDSEWTMLKMKTTRLTIESGCSSAQWHETFAQIANSFLADGVCCYVTAVYADYSTREFGTSIALYCPLPPTFSHELYQKTHRELRLQKSPNL